MWELNPPRQIGSLEYQPLYEYSMDGFILRASTPSTLRPAYLTIFFFLTLIGLIIILRHLITLLSMQPIISEAKTTCAFRNWKRAIWWSFYTATTKLDDGIVLLPLSYSAFAYAGALYFTKALKPSQFLVIDLTLRALTQPKTRAFHDCQRKLTPSVASCQIGYILRYEPFT